MARNIPSQFFEPLYAFQSELHLHRDNSDMRTLNCSTGQTSNESSLLTMALPTNPQTSLTASSKSPYSSVYDECLPMDSGDSDFSHKREHFGSNFQDEDENEGEILPRSGKRHRQTDWPLKTVEDAEKGSRRPPLGILNPVNSNSIPKGKARPPSVRSSKFVEGSMGDRISQKPDLRYIEENGSLQSYDLEQDYTAVQQRQTIVGDKHGDLDHSIAAGLPDQKSDLSRQSAIFRFGKSVYAAFNPSNWKIFNKFDGRSESFANDSLYEEQEVLTDRPHHQINGFSHQSSRYSALTNKRRIQTSDLACSTVNSESKAFIDEEERPISLSESKLEDKRHGRVFLETPLMSLIKDYENGISKMQPVSDRSYGQTEQPLKTHQDFAYTGLRASIDIPNVADTRKDLPRLPSQRNLKKQQRLVKKVSDLEGKLEVAKRHLSEALGEPVSISAVAWNGQQRFRGSQPDVPSKALSPNEAYDIGVGNEIGKAVSTDVYHLIAKHDRACHSSALSVEIRSPRGRNKFIKREQTPLISTPNSEVRTNIPLAASPKENLKKRKSTELDTATEGHAVEVNRIKSDDDDSSDVRRSRRAQKILKLESQPFCVNVKSKPNLEVLTQVASRPGLLEASSSMPSKPIRKLVRRGGSYASPPPNQDRSCVMARTNRKIDVRNLLKDQDDEVEDVVTHGVLEGDPPSLPKFPVGIKMNVAEQSESAKAPVSKLSPTCSNEKFDQARSRQSRGAKHSLRGSDNGSKIHEKRPLKRDPSFEWDADVF